MTRMESHVCPPVGRDTEHVEVKQSGLILLEMIIIFLYLPRKSQ